MNTTQHTPGPWQIRNNGSAVEITDSQGQILAAVYAQFYRRGDMPAGDYQARNAQFIVRACNSHDALLAACQAVVNNYGHGRSIRPQVEQCAEAIARVTAGESAK